MPEIGETLREARMRRRIDMAEVESATKIRAKYLRALESEEWELLPGPTFVKTFLRTYAEYLELDSRLLVEEYKQRFERPAGLDVTPLNLRRQRRRRRVAPRLGPGLVVVLGIVVLLGALYLLGVSGNGGDETEPPAAVETATPAGNDKDAQEEGQEEGRRPPKPVSVSIVATGQVYVCMEDARGRADRRQAHAGGRPAHPHLPQPLLQGDVRHRRGADPPERQGLPRGREPRPRRLLPALRAQAPADHARPGRLHVSARAGIIVTGTEVLSGIIADRNGPWLSGKLRERGVQLAHVMIVGDRPRTCAPRWSSSRASGWT